MPLRLQRIPCTAGALLLSLVLLGVLAGPAGAVNKLEGYYEAEISAQKDDGKWHFGSPGDNGMPKHFTEMKFWSWPNDRFETYVRVWAQSNRDDDRSAAIDYYAPPWISAEGHIKLRGGKYESYIFYRQSRFYINDEPLLRLVDDGRLKNDSYGPLAQGVRFDFWDTEFLGVRNLGGTVILSDNGGTYSYNGIDYPKGDNSTIMRLRHKAWDERIETGAMFIRKDWTTIGQESILSDLHNDVYSLDVSFSPRELTSTSLRLGPVDLEQTRWTVEGAVSHSPYRELQYGSEDEHQRALAFEVRQIHLGDLTLNGWYNDFGEGFRDESTWRFSDGGEYNRVQKHVEAIWLVPRKAVTAKVNYDHYRKRYADVPGGGLRPTTEWYGEMYLEFIKGFKARFAYKDWYGFDSDVSVYDFKHYPDWFAEVSVENFLAKIRIQARVHDAGTFRQVTIFGFDMNVNLTDRLKGYLRAMNVNEEIEARHTMFAQLKYDLGWGSELYFEYGDAGQSDNLTYTDWFVSEGSSDNLRDRFKLLVKAWY